MEAEAAAAFTPAGGPGTEGASSQSIAEGYMEPSLFSWVGLASSTGSRQGEPRLETEIMGCETEETLSH